MEVAIVDHAFQLELFRLVKFWLIISMIFISIFSQINFLNTIHISNDLFFSGKNNPIMQDHPPPPKKKITIQNMFVVPLLLFNTNCTMWFYCKAEMKKREREREERDIKLGSCW